MKPSKIAVFGVLLSGVCLLHAGCGKTAEEENPQPLVAVKVAAAETTHVRRAIKAPATVWPREQANISARITAPIRELRSRKGDIVEKDHVLAVLENRDLVANEQEAVAAVADADATLQLTMDGSLPTEIEKARGQLETAEAGLNQSQKNYDRRNELFKQGAIPGRDLLQSQTELAQAKTAYEVARKSLELLKTKSGEKDIAIARSRLEQAKARLNNVRAQLQYSELRSPFGGTITEQLQYPGDMAQPGVTTFTVMDLSVVFARAQVPEADVSDIKAGQACEFAPMDSASSRASGRVTLINKAVDPQRRTVEVWCEMANADRKLRANIFGEASFYTEALDALVVPLAAVQFNEGTHTGTVMVVDSKKIAHKRDVETGDTFDDKVQILKGLAAGETIIVEAGYGLPDGTAVSFGEKAK